LLLRHRERLRPLQPDTVETRLLHFLVEERRQVVDEKTRQSHRLTDCLRLYFPQVLKWFDDVTSPLLGDLLDRWPNLEQLQRVHPGTLRKFFHDHNCRSAEKNEQRIAAIYEATAATKDPAVVEGCALIARGLVALLKTLRANIATFDKRIAELAAAHPDTAIFASLPGAGAVLMPRLIVAFGTRRDRYQDAYEVQCYSGIAPVTESSGSSQWVHFRFACPKFLRQTFHEFAGCSIQWSEWAKAYYRHLCQEESKSHHAAVRSLAFKWIRIIFRCWKDSKPYNEEIYMQSLRRRGSLHVGALGGSTNATWKNVAGFQKLSENNA
jgi:transposase